MKSQSALRTPHSAFRTQRAFTLVELLTVIAIISILAGLIVAGAGIATVKARTSRVQGERASLVTAIEAYKAKKGFYPPDNPSIPNLPWKSPLFYELTGTTIDAAGNFHAVTGEVFSPAQVFSVFGVNGFINSSSDPTEPPINFLKVSPNSRTVTIFLTPATPASYTLLGLPVPPGLPAALGGSTGKMVTPWNYVSSNPTNNPTEFDLWMDVTWRGTTNRISNWHDDPQPQ